MAKTKQIKKSAVKEKTATKEKSKKSEPKIPTTGISAPRNEMSFSSLNNILNKFAPEGGDILEDSEYARIKEWISTGSYIVNAAMSGSLFGGMPSNRSLGLAAEEGVGKTFLALSICRNAQAMGYDIIYCDSEGSIDPEFVKRLGVDPKRVRIQPITTIEEYANFVSNIINEFKKLKEAKKPLPKLMIVMDSYGNLSSLKEREDTLSGNDKRDMTKQQKGRGMFRVIGNDCARYSIPTIYTAHVYEKVGSYIPGKEVSGGGGLKYNVSIMFMMTKSKLEDKESEEKNKKNNIESTRVGIKVTLSPIKQRFARPIKVEFHIPFYKRPNPFVGLEKFVSWKGCGILRGKALTEKEWSKLSPAEQKECFEFKSLDGKTLYAQPKDTARTLVCKHLGGETPLVDLFTEKVFTKEVLEELDNNVIKPTFMLPSIESLDDLKELSSELYDDTDEDLSEIDCLELPEIQENEAD